MKRLHSLEPEEVSLVKRGANKKKFLVLKDDEGTKMPRKESDSLREVRNLVNGVDPKIMAKVDKVVKNMSGMKPEDLPPGKDSATYKSEEVDPEMHPEGPKPLSDRAQVALKAMARIAAPFKDEMGDHHVMAALKEVGIGGDEEQPGEVGHAIGHSEDGMGKAMHDMNKGKAIPEKVEEKHHAEALEFAKKAYKSHMEKMGYQKYPAEQPAMKAKHLADEDDEEGEENVDKSKVSKAAESVDLSAFPEAQRPALQQIFKSHAALVQKNEELTADKERVEKELKTERELRRDKEFIQKAHSFTHVGGDVKELAETMKALEDADPSGKALKLFESKLRAANEQVKKGELFGTMGTTISKSGSAGNDAFAKLNSLVDQIVMKGSDVTREQVFDQVIQTPEGKRLYAEYWQNLPMNTRGQ